MKKIKIQNPDVNLVTLVSVADPVQAELIHNMLTDHGIENHIDGERQGGFTGTFEIGIVIRATDKEKAKEFIEVHFPNL